MGRSAEKTGGVRAGAILGGGSVSGKNEDSALFGMAVGSLEVEPWWEQGLKNERLLFEGAKDKGKLRF